MREFYTTTIAPAIAAQITTEMNARRTVHATSRASAMEALLHAPPCCEVCGQEGDSLRRCGKCRVSRYCGTTCQTFSWASHKHVCARLASGTLLLTEAQVAEIAAQPSGSRAPHTWSILVHADGITTQQCDACAAEMTTVHAASPAVLPWMRPAHGVATYMVPSTAHVEWCSGT